MSMNNVEQYFLSSKALRMLATSLWTCCIVLWFLQKPNCWSDMTFFPSRYFNSLAFRSFSKSSDIEHKQNDNGNSIIILFVIWSCPGDFFGAGPLICWLVYSMKSLKEMMLLHREKECILGKDSLQKCLPFRHHISPIRQSYQIGWSWVISRINIFAATQRDNSTYQYSLKRG